MNGQAAQIITSAAVFRGELQRMLLALGIVLAILVIAWAVEEFRLRKTASVMGWLGFISLCLLGLGAVGLITVGLL